jgi:hypothetical protein
VVWAGITPFPLPSPPCLHPAGESGEEPESGEELESGEEPESGEEGGEEGEDQEGPESGEDPEGGAGREQRGPADMTITDENEGELLEHKAVEKKQVKVGLECSLINENNALESCRITKVPKRLKKDSRVTALFDTDKKEHDVEWKHLVLVVSQIQAQGSQGSDEE